MEIKKNNLENISFSSVPMWLQNSDEYCPWNEGKKKAWQLIESLYSRSAPSLFDVLPDLFTEADPLAVRLLVCWLYHWEMAGTDKKGTDVVHSVESGKGFQGNGQLGGNPFFDLVLAQALCDLQEKAALVLQDKYLNYLRQIGRRVEGCAQFDDEIPCWWGPFYMSLTGTSSEKAKATLLSFHGFSGIRNWLRIALGLFLRRFLIKETGREIGESHFNRQNGDSRGGLFDDMAAPENDDTAEDEWLSIRKPFLCALQQAKDLLSDEEWTRLYYHFGAKLQNQQIARLYNENGSTTTRHRNAALLRFREGLSQAIEAVPVLRDLGDRIFSAWGREAGDLMQEFFASEGTGI